jgi:hypothetical protein
VGTGPLGISSMSLPRLESLSVVVGCGSHSCILVLSTLLKCAPMLHTLTIDAEDLRKSMDNITFFTDVLGLQRDHPHVKVTLVCPNSLV